MNLDFVVFVLADKGPYTPAGPAGTGSENPWSDGDRCGPFGNGCLFRRIALVRHLVPEIQKHEEGVDRAVGVQNPPHRNGVGAIPCGDGELHNYASAAIGTAFQV